ncbi:MAG: hypothetical protein WCE51_02480 [Chthoniobacterales bacterium]
MKTKLLLTTVVSTLVALGTPAVSAVGPAVATPNKAIQTDRGFTAVTLDANLIPTLGSLGVTLSPLAPTTLFNASQGTASFPIVSGIFDPNSTTGEIGHSGGLILSGGGTQLAVSSFLIDLPSSGSPVITGLATLNGALVGRIPLFDLGLSGVSISYKGSKVTIAGVDLTLNADAAATLNTIFGTSAFAGGLPIGTGEVASYYDKIQK